MMEAEAPAQPTQNQPPITVTNIKTHTESTSTAQRLTSRQAIVKIIKAICWFATIIPSGIATGVLIKYNVLHLVSYGWYVKYLLVISVLSLTTEIVFLIIFAANALPESILSRKNMVWGMMAYNSVVILLFFIGMLMIFLPLTTQLIHVHRLTIPYTVFAGIGIAASAVDIAIYVDWLKVTQ